MELTFIQIPAQLLQQRWGHDVGVAVEKLLAGQGVDLLKDLGKVFVAAGFRG